MDTAVMRIGEAMGWFVERAEQRQRKLKTAGTIAALAWKTKPHGCLGSQEALANRLRDLDAADAFEWWLGPRGKPYLVAVAGVLKVEPAELIAWIEASRPAPDEDARWFRFEVFPGLRPLDLDGEDPYPGVPRALWRGDGPRGPTWWHAPPGAGRTLVGRWLARRHGWSFVSSQSEVSERTFVEHEGADLAGQRLPDRVVIASPHPMPERLRQQRWEEVRGEPDWEVALLDWAEARLPQNRRFDAKLARKALAEGKLAAPTPGSLLEALAELEALGPELLTEGVHPARALEAWARAHAGRADRAARPASRDWLREHGGWLLPRIELARLTRGLPVTPETVLACMPELPAASADTIREARDAGDVDAALELLRPAPADLVAAMSALRWLLPGEWGLPSRVLGHLRGAVVEFALDELDELRPLGNLLDTREVASVVVHGLAHPSRLSRWTARLSTGKADDSSTALVADGLLKALALLAGQRTARLGAPARALAGALNDAYCEPCPDLGLEVRVEDAEVWTSIAWLTMLRLGVDLSPAADRLSRWTWHAGQVLEWRDPQSPTGRLLRGLAADTLGLLIHANPEWRSPRPIVALAALAYGETPEKPALWDLSRIEPLEVVERMAAPWATSIEAVSQLLWPAWMLYGIPDESDTDKLAGIWAAHPGGEIEGRLRTQLAEHATRGVPLPDRLWAIAIASHSGHVDLLERAPLGVLFECAKGREQWIAPVVWKRAPERAVAVIAAAVAEAEFDWHQSAWLASIPPDRAVDIVEVLRASASASGAVAARRYWADRAIRQRVPGWERVWEWVRVEQPL